VHCTGYAGTAGFSTLVRVITHPAGAVVSRTLSSAHEETMSSQPTHQAFDQVDVLKNVVLFTLSGIHMWTGRRRLSADDFDAGTNLPPETLASLGSKKIFDPQHLKIFEALKRRAHNTCADHGARFLSGYAVPKGKAGDVARQLQVIGAEFNAEKINFLQDYERNVQSWLATNSAWAHILRKAVTPKSEVDSQLRFGYEACAVSPTEDVDLDGPLHNAVGGLAGNLLSEVAQVARETIEGSLIGREKVTRKFLSPIRRIRNKLDGLAFIDPQIVPVVSHIDSVLASIVQAGPIEGRDLAALSGLLYLIASPEKTREHGRRVLESEPFADEDTANGPVTEADTVAFAAVDSKPDEGQDTLSRETVLAQPEPIVAAQIILPRAEPDKPALLLKPSPKGGVLNSQKELSGVPTIAKAHLAECRRMLAGAKAPRKLVPLGF
jgi:hypothetical protein